MFSLEKPAAKDDSIAKTQVVFSCQGNDLCSTFDSAVNEHIDGSRQTQVVCRHFTHQESIHGLLSQATCQMPLQMNANILADANGYCLVRIVSLNPNRMVVIVDQQFSHFAKDGGAGRALKNKNNTGRMICDITLLRNNDVWRVQGCSIDYVDNVNSVGSLYNPRNESWERGLSWQFRKGGVVKVANPIAAQCISGDEWLVSDDLPRAIKLREGDVNLYPPMRLWEEKITEAESFVSAGSLSFEAMQKMGRLYKSADVDSDCDLKRLCRQNPDEKPEDIAVALAHSLAIVSKKREELTQRAEGVGKALFSLKRDFAPVDASLFEQNSETQQNLKRLTHLYNASTEWHKEKLSLLIDLAQEDWKEKTVGDLLVHHKTVKELKGESFTYLEPYRMVDSEGGKITSQLKIKDTSDPLQKARSENLAPHIALSYTYSGTFVWYRKKVEHQIEQELKKRGVAPDTPA